MALYGCGGGSDSDNSLLDTAITVVQESDEDDYKKSEYRFYGLFAGVTGEGTSNVSGEIIVDNSTQTFASVTIAGSFENFKFRQGQFSKSESTFSSDSLVYEIDEDISLISLSREEDIGSRFHFNYETQTDFDWSINGSGRESSLEFTALNSTISINPRGMIYPAKLSFFDSEFISSIEYNNTDLVTSITIDSDG